MKNEKLLDLASSTQSTANSSLDFLFTHTDSNNVIIFAHVHALPEIAGTKSNTGVLSK